MSVFSKRIIEQVLRWLLERFEADTAGRIPTDVSVTPPLPNLTPNPSPSIERGTYMVNARLAAAVGGADAALLVERLRFWLRRNESLGKTLHFVDGRWWTYNSYQAWADDCLPWLSADQVRRVFARLEALGVVVSVAIRGRGKPKWYSIDEAALDGLMNLTPAGGVYPAPTVRPPATPPQPSPLTGREPGAGATPPPNPSPSTPPQPSPQAGKADTPAESQGGILKSSDTLANLPDTLAKTPDTLANLPDTPAESPALSQYESSDLNPSQVIQLDLNPPATPERDDVLLLIDEFRASFGKAKATAVPYIQKEIGRLGLAQAREVAERCAAAGGKSWAYVVAALRKETPPPTPSPKTSPPAPLAANGEGERFEPDDPTDGGLEQAENWELMLDTMQKPRPTDVPDWAWQLTKSQLEYHVGRANWHVYIEPLWLAAVENGRYVFVAPNAQVRRMVEGRLVRTIRRVLGDIAGNREVEIVVTLDQAGAQLHAPTEASPSPASFPAGGVYPAPTPSPLASLHEWRGELTPPPAPPHSIGRGIAAAVGD